MTDAKANWLFVKSPIEKPDGALANTRPWGVASRRTLDAGAPTMSGGGPGGGTKPSFRNEDEAARKFPRNSQLYLLFLLFRTFRTKRRGVGEPSADMTAPRFPGRACTAPRPRPERVGTLAVSSVPSFRRHRFLCRARPFARLLPPVHIVPGVRPSFRRYSSFGFGRATTWKSASPPGSAVHSNCPLSPRTQQRAFRSS